MLDCLFSNLLILTHQLSDEKKAAVECRRRLANVCGNGILKVGSLAALEGVEKSIADRVDLCSRTPWCGRQVRGNRISSKAGRSLRILIHGLSNILSTGLG